MANHKVIKIECPDYVLGGDLNLIDIGVCIDKALVKHFLGQEIVLRGIQSKKHKLPKDQLIESILVSGTDRYDESYLSSRKDVSDKPIDLFGLRCRATKGDEISLSILEGFHKWKPMALERPQRKIDIWLIYDANQLENIQYIHGHYGVKARDAYVFKNRAHKQDALLGILLIE